MHKIGTKSPHLEHQPQKQALLWQLGSSPLPSHTRIFMSRAPKGVCTSTIHACQHHKREAPKECINVNNPPANISGNSIKGLL